MPRKLTTIEEITKAWERKRERDKKAQANWVSNHHEEHLARMKKQYLKKKAVVEEEPKKRKLPTSEVPPSPSNITERIKEYKASNPSSTQKDIAVALSTSQSSVSRALKK